MVVVTDEDGNTDSDVTITPVGQDLSDDVSIIDRMGVQSDGTGIVGDQLRVSYGSTFGTPTAITWYRDGSVLTTWGNGNGNLNQDGALWLNINAARGTGVYKATVVAEGTTYTTNELTITNKEEAATIIDFTIEDDYTDGTDITYNTDDDTAVATVTLSKNYAGTFGFYKSNDSKFSGRINRFATTTVNSERAVAEYINADAGGDGTNRAIAQYTAVLTPDAPTNYNVLNINAGPNRAIGHINTDGTVTYKFNIAAGTLTRGSDYVVTFDQTSILTDTPGTGIANMFEEAVTVPYVTAPASIAVTKVSASNKPEVTFQDEDGNALGWMQAQKGGAALTATGFTSAQIYSAKSKTNDPKGSDVSALTNANQNNSVEKGVWTSSVTAPADPAAYWFATATTRKGIFGEKEETLTSEPAPLAQKAATMMNLVESKTDAKTATVTFENLRADGTLYIVRGSRVWNATTAIGGAVDTDYYTTAERIYASYNAGVSEATTGKVDVEAGTKTVDVAGAIDEWKAEQLTKTVAAGNSENWYGNNYIAVFVPNDEENYGLVYTNSANFNASTDLDKTLSTDSSGMTLGQIAASVSFDKTAGTCDEDGTTNGLTIITSTGLKAKDQFGNAMVTFQAPKDVDSVVVKSNDVTNIEEGAAKYTVAADGQVTVYLTRKTATDAGDGYTISFLGTTMTVNNTSAAAINAGTSGANLAGFEVKVGGDTLHAGPVSAAGTAVVNFPKITTSIAATTGKLATFSGAFAAVANAATLEESANGIVWTTATTDGVLTLGAGVITEDGTAATYKADTYYRIKVDGGGTTPVYINMTGSKTDAARLANIAALSNVDLTTGAAGPTTALTTTDQFGNAYAIAAAASVTPSAGNTGGAITLSLGADKKLTVGLASTTALVKNDSFTCVIGDVTIYAKVKTAGSTGVAVVTVDKTAMPNDFA